MEVVNYILVVLSDNYILERVNYILEVCGGSELYIYWSYRVEIDNFILEELSGD